MCIEEAAMKQYEILCLINRCIKDRRKPMKRERWKSIAIMRVGMLGLLVLILSLIFPGIVHAQTTVTVIIPSTQPWTDTGLTVSAGDVISITASGDVIYADPDTDHHAGPDGTDNPSGTCKYVVTNSAVPAHSLIGNIADSSSLDGRGFFVGSNFQGSVPIPNNTNESGKLFLGFNDGAVYCDRSGYDAWGFEGDNHGSFTATITITQSSTACPVTISNINPSSYSTGTAYVGSLCYVDRTYTITSLPEELDGLDMILTANDDEIQTGSIWLSFNVINPAIK